MGSPYKRKPSPRAYGVMYENSTGTQINMATAGNYYGWVSATDGGGINTAFEGNATADRLTVQDAGTYFVLGTFSFSGSVSIVAHGRLFKNSSGSDSIEFERTLSASGDIGSASFSGICTLAENDYVDVRFSANGNTKNIVVNHCNLLVFKMA